VPIDPIDDLPHRQESSLVEQWQFDFWSAEYDLGGWVHFTYDQSSRKAWYVAALLGVDRQLVLVVDPKIPIPQLSQYLEFRAEGIWAQHVCETPLEHWTVGLEAFGVTLETAEDAMGNQWGKRTGVGLDLEWERIEDTEETVTGFRQRCSVSGEVLIDEQAFGLHVDGWRSRSWGPDLGLVDRPTGNGIHIDVGGIVLTIEPDFMGQQWDGRLSR
tara:strand:- start:745 stop:1389 length:645 start_codon:yes stop_codon:yes gene_type:complete